MTTRTASGARPNAGTKGVARADREEQIVAVACKVFGESGFGGTSVADVAEAAGISKPLIYNYFGSKEGLYAVCVRHAAEVLTAEIERTAASGTVGLARAVVTLDGMFRVLAPQPWIWRLVFDPTAPRDADTEEVLADYESRILAFGTEGVAELLHLAGNDDPTDTSAMRAVWENVFRSLIGWWLEHPGESPDAMTERCVRLFSAVFGEIDTSALTTSE
jgi:AcrR family transcriptional regulator